MTLNTMTLNLFYWLKSTRAIWSSQSEQDVAFYNQSGAKVKAIVILRFKRFFPRFPLVTRFQFPPLYGYMFSRAFYRTGYTFSRALHWFTVALVWTAVIGKALYISYC